MRAFILQVRGGQEMKSAYMIDRFLQESGVDTIHLSTFEREKYQYLDEDFRKGTVGYVLMLSTEKVDMSMWYRVREYMQERGLYVSWPKDFDPQDLAFGPFLRAVIEKINDFIDRMNARVFSAYFGMEKNKVKGIMSYVHNVFGLAQDTAYGLYARWVSYAIRPVSVIDTG